MIIHRFKSQSIFLILLLLMLLSACTGQGQTSGPIVIHNGIVFTATGDDPISDGAVVIENGLITEVGPEAELEIPQRATRIDAQGGMIMPGLIDARASTLLNRIEVIDGDIDPPDLELYLAFPLRAGVTTYRAVGWDFDTYSDLSVLRNALASHVNSIPTVVFTGMITHAEGNIFEIYPNDTIGVVTVEEAQQATEDLIESGVDQVGYLQAIPPDRRAETTAESRTSLSVEQQMAVVEVAHEQGLRVIAQTSFPEDAALAVEAGVDELAGWPHGSEEPLSDELVETLADNSVPVLTGFSVGVIRPYEGDVRRFIDAGGTVVFGTFAPNSTALNNPYNEMNLMALVGEMTPTEILMAATSNAADAVGLGDTIGTLETGKQADVIVVNGNPLEDLRAMRDVSAVVKGGEIVFQADDTEE